MVGLEPRDSEESQAMYQRPLEISLKHSSISTEGACPFIQPQSGVAALHEYAEWINDLNQEAGAGDGKRGNTHTHTMVDGAHSLLVQFQNFPIILTSPLYISVLILSHGDLDVFRYIKNICLLMLSSLCPSPCSSPGSLGSGVDSV